MTTMNDGREVDFGKKEALYNVTHENDVTIMGAFSDGEYKSYTVQADKLSEWAAYGLRAFVKSKAQKSSQDWNSEVLDAGPFATQPRASSGTAALPIEKALVSVTGKTLEAVRAFLNGKSRKEVNALKADPRIAPVYAAEQAALLAAKADRKALKADAPVEQVDLLAGLDEVQAEV